jgi:2-dehydro-3-deoxygalactonokinase
MTAQIAIDWGTSRFRGYLVVDGEIIDRMASDEGMAATAKDAFAAVLMKNCAGWLSRHPQAPITMAGMVGSRNGWMEVPYAQCPAGPEDIARSAGRVLAADGVSASIIPGLLCRNDGIADVMRGEETLIIGCGAEEGTVIQPGTHSKWARLSKGRIAGFRTFMTGEFFALLSQHSILRLLAEPAVDNAGFAQGLEAAERPGGLGHIAFSARARVLDGTLKGRDVAAYLSGMLIGLELREATADASGPLFLIADGRMAENYAAAIARRGLVARLFAPEDCLVKGLARIGSYVR